MLFLHILNNFLCSGMNENVCSVCGKTLASKKNVLAHIKRVHKDQQLEPISAPTTQSEMTSTELAAPTVTSSQPAGPLRRRGAARRKSVSEHKKKISASKKAY